MNTRSLVNYLVSQQAVITEPVKRAFGEINRQDFVLPLFYDEAYGDYPLPVGHGQTISQPSTVSFMLELLQAQPGDRALDVGAGTAFTTLLLAEIVGPTGRVRGVELVPEILEMGRQNLAKYPRYFWASLEPAGPALGLPEQAPFDRILVSAAASSLPQDLVSQLKVGGTMVVPIDHSIYKVMRGPHDVQLLEFPGFAFVALQEPAKN